MERKRQTRTPFNINALLIGEKTVPKGCRVINVSETGMLLHCDADGRLLTFKNGDPVEVQLTVRQAGKQRKFTISSCVREVAANSVDVEFNQPDPQLTGIIEAYRVSEKHSLEATLGRMNSKPVTGRHAASADRGTDAGKKAGQPVKHSQRHNNRPYYAVILATVFAVCIITGGYVYTASIDSRISTLEILGKRQSADLTDMQSRLFSATLQEGRYASLNARITALSDAFISLENRLGQGVPPSTSTAAQQVTAPERSLDAQEQTAAAGKAVSKPATGTRSETNLQDVPRKPVATTTLEAPATPAAIPPVDGIGTVATDGPGSSAKVAGVTGFDAGIPPSKNETIETEPPADSGPWVINLLSSQDRAYVESFRTKSGASEHDAVVNNAMVNGKQFWRLQIAGFNSAAEARNHAKTVKQALRIKEVWIFRQK